MLGPRIAALRRSAGLSQAQLADELKISPSAVGMYEQGRREPAVETLVTLARIFGVTTDYLLTGTAQSAADAEKAGNAFCTSLEAAGQQLSRRKEAPLSRQELAVFFAALLSEP